MSLRLHPLLQGVSLRAGREAGEGKRDGDLLQGVSLSDRGRVRGDTDRDRDYGTHRLQLTSLDLVPR